MTQNLPDAHTWEEAPAQSAAGWVPSQAASVPAGPRAADARAAEASAGGDVDVNGSGHADAADSAAGASSLEQAAKDAMAPAAGGQPAASPAPETALEGRAPSAPQVAHAEEGVLAPSAAVTGSSHPAVPLRPTAPENAFPGDVGSASGSPDVSGASSSADGRLETIDGPENPLAAPGSPSSAGELESGVAGSPGGGAEGGGQRGDVAPDGAETVSFATEAAAPAPDGAGLDAGAKAGSYLIGQPWLDARFDGPAAPALRAGVLQQLASQLQEMVAALRQEATPQGIERVFIRLRPEFLGEVVLRISVDPNGNVYARFAVDNPQVRAWIEQDLPQLREALAQHGLHLADAGVDSGPGSGGDGWFLAGAGPGWGDGSGQPARHGQAPAAGHAAAGPLPGADLADEEREAAGPRGFYGASLIDVRV